MALYFKVHFVFYFIITSVAAEEMECQPSDFNDLFPCGNVSRYKTLTIDTGTFINFKRVGKYCYSDSRREINHHQSWFSAQDQCSRNGGHIAEFKQPQDWEEFKNANKKENIFDQSDEYWLGARTYLNNWWWASAKKRPISIVRWHGARLPYDRHHHNYHKAGFLCLSTTNNLWYKKDCYEDHHFICQKESVGDYYSRLEFLSNGDLNRDRVISVFDGHTVSLTCRGLAAKVFRISVATQKHGTTDLLSTGDADDYPTLGIFKIERSVRYFFGSQRCLRYYNVKLIINMTEKLSNSVFTCSHEDKTYSDYDLSFTLLWKNNKAIRPTITLQNTKMVDGRPRPDPGDKIAFVCTSIIGNNTAMSLAITQGDKEMAMTIYYYKHTERILGTRPSWFKDLSLKIDRALYGYQRINYINLTVEITFSRKMMGMVLGCYSRDVLATMGRRFILNKEDDLSAWMEFYPNVKIVDVAAKLEIKGLSDDVLNGAEKIAQCDTFTVNCIGFGASRESIGFKIISGGSETEWRFDTTWRFSVIASITEIKHFEDPNYGPSIKVVLRLSVTPETATTTLQCENINLAEHHIETDSRKLNLETIVGVLPPNLTSQRHKELDSDKFLTLHCKSRTGQGDVQSWKVVDNKFRVNKVLVYNDGRVSGVKFPWLKVQMVEEMFDFVCGQTMKSRLIMYKLSPKEFGVNFTCYSYNIKSSKRVVSKHPKIELSATYIIFGGAGIQEKSAIGDFLKDFGWFLMVTGIASVVCFYLYRRRKAEENQIRSANDNEGNMRGPDYGTRTTLKAKSDPSGPPSSTLSPGSGTYETSGSLVSKSTKRSQQTSATMGNLSNAQKPGSVGNTLI